MPELLSVTGSRSVRPLPVATGAAPGFSDTSRSCTAARGASATRAATSSSRDQGASGSSGTS